MTYAYIRVSSDKQTVENQRFEINNYIKRQNITVDYWVGETISGTVAPGKRCLGDLLKKVNKGDVIICSELSRLGRKMYMIMAILNDLMERGVTVLTVKEGYKLGDDLQSKVMSFAFSIAAEIERSLISQRTKEALKRKKKEGVVLGRPKGSKSKKYKLSGKEDEIKKMLNQGIPKTRIIAELGVSSSTLYSFMKREGIFIPGRNPL